MESVQTIREILGWITILNVAIVLFSFLILIIAGSPIKRIHAKVFGLSEGDLSRAYFQYLAQYEIAIFAFNLAPYLAMRIAG